MVVLVQCRDIFQTVINETNRQTPTWTGRISRRAAYIANCGCDRNCKRSHDHLRIRVKSLVVETVEVYILPSNILAMFLAACSLLAAPRKSLA